MFLTAELVFTVLMLAAEKSKATFIAPGKFSSKSSFYSMPLFCIISPILHKEKLLIVSMAIVGIGLALFVAELAGMFISGIDCKS